MSLWLMPAAAAAFWAGLLAWPLAGHLAPVWAWLVPGLSALVGAVASAPGKLARPDPLQAAGLARVHEPAAVAAVSSDRLSGGRGPPAVPLLLSALGVFLLGVGWGGIHANRVEGSLLSRLAPASIEAVATLRTDPSPGGFGWSAIAQVATVWWEDGAAEIHEPLWIQGAGDPPEAVRGDRVELSGELRLPTDGGFAAVLRRRGIGASLQVRDVVCLGPSTNPLIRAAQGFRAFAGRSIRTLFPRTEAGLLMGLALGDDSMLDPALARDFQATGLGHLLVVSGENVAMVLGPVLGLALLLRLSRVPRFLLGLGTVVFFVVLTGAEPSVMRAGVMAGLTLLGVFLGRPRATGAILAGAVLFLLVLDPSLVWSIGFQLSVAATAGMVAMASPLAERLRFLSRPIALAAGTTLAAQVGVTPVLLFHFHEVPAVTVLANLLAFPAVSPALVLGLAAAGVGVLLEPAARLLAALALLPMRYLELIADRLASAPVPWVTSGGGIVSLVGGVVTVCLVALWLRSRRGLPRAVMVVGAALVPLFVWSTALSAGPPSGLVVHFFDVGQGDAAVVMSPDGASVLIDGGPEPGQVAAELSALGVRRLDIVVASHPHADHIVGLPAVLARFPVGTVLEPGCPDDSPLRRELLAAIADEGIPVEHPRAGESLAVGDLRLDVLSPDRCWAGTESDANNDALVIAVSYREDTVLFATEPEEPAQRALLDARVALGADVLKVPHHGAATSLPEFFQAVAPELAVVSVGPNDYGHPVPEVLEEIRATGARVLRTDLAGDITITFARDGLLVESSRT